MSTENVSAEQLRLLIERIERLERTRRVSPTTSRTSMPKPRGPASTPRRRSIVRLRAMEKAARQEQEALLETYKAALGLTD